LSGVAAGELVVICEVIEMRRIGDREGDERRSGELGIDPI
jgi:hypothetical protein